MFLPLTGHCIAPCATYSQEDGHVWEKHDDDNGTCLPGSSGAPPLGTHRRWQLLQCNFCPFVSRFESAIRRHQLRHTKERPHRCEYCPKNFQRRYQLTQHMAIRHGTKPMPVPRQTIQDFGDHMASLDPLGNSSSQFQMDMGADIFKF